jgi:predicted membrane channel-forming protein YqfA (hemolysin III family)
VKGLLDITFIPIAEVLLNRDGVVCIWFILLDVVIGITGVLFPWGFITGEIIILSSLFFALLSWLNIEGLALDPFPKRFREPTLT